MPDAIHAAHRASNNLPRQHDGTVMRDPATGEVVTIDNDLVPLIAALWAAGIRTVASCQNVAEFAYGAVPDLVPAMLTGGGPLGHVDTITRGLGYIRMVADDATADTLAEALAPHLTSVQALPPLLQIEFTAQEIPHLAGCISLSRSGSLCEEALRPSGKAG